MADKIKILWIEDEPDSANPPRDLGEYKEYFEIVHKTPSGLNDSIKCIEEYTTFLEKYHNGQLSNVFPVEIVSADYDLSKYNPARNTVGNKSHHNDDPDTDGPPQDLSTNDSNVKQKKYQPFEHDGCIINVQYVTEFGNHPCGSVVTTYQDPKERHKTAKHLEGYLKRAWGVDVSSNEGKARTWKNIIISGVKALQKRIEDLYIDEAISVSFEDLKAIYDGTGNQLTIRSKYATRKLKVRGLFMNHDDKSWRSEARKWAKDMLMTIVDDGQIESIQKAENISKEIWAGYSNDELFDKRWELSELCSAKDSLDDLQKERLSELIDYFGVDPKFSSCSKNHIDLRNYSTDDHTRRWIALFMLLRLLERVVKAQKNWRKVAGDTASLLNADNFTIEDWLLAIYPIPSNPVVMPFSQFHKDPKKRANALQTWTRGLEDKKRTKAPIVIKEILSGKAGSISSAERRILLEKALDMPGLTKKDWNQCVLAKTILFEEPNNE